MPNGQKEGDREDNFTCITNEGGLQSVVDYALKNKIPYDQINSFMLLLIQNLIISL